jgi:hypothetical protein
MGRFYDNLWSRGLGSCSAREAQLSVRGESIPAGVARIGEVVPEPSESGASRGHRYWAAWC